MVIQILSFQQYFVPHDIIDILLISDWIILDVR